MLHLGRSQDHTPASCPGAGQGQVCSPVENDRWPSKSFFHVFFSLSRSKVSQNENVIDAIQLPTCCLHLSQLSKASIPACKSFWLYILTGVWELKLAVLVITVFLCMWSLMWTLPAKPQLVSPLQSPGESYKLALNCWQLSSQWSCEWMSCHWRRHGGRGCHGPGWVTLEQLSNKVIHSCYYLLSI